MQVHSIPTPEAMWKHFLDYKQWTEDNPRTKDLATKDSLTHKTELSLPRCLSWNGFNMYVAVNKICVHLKNYRYNTKGYYDDFIDMMELIDSCIKEDQTSGSMAGIYNPMVATKLLGLIDESTVTVNNKGISKIEIIRGVKHPDSEQDEDEKESNER